MLRLNPTEIRLDSRDLEWHRHRMDGRLQASRVSVPPTDMTNVTQRSPRKHHDSRAQPSSFVSPQKHAVLAGETDKLQASMYHNKPVPKGSRAFWDRVLAEAGTPTRTKSTSSGSAMIIEQSEEFLDTIRSSRVSVEGHPRNSQYASDEDYNDELGEDGSRLLSSSMATRQTKHSQLTPPESEQSISSESDHEPDLQQLLKTIPQSTSSKSRSWLSFKRKTPPSRIDRVSDIDDAMHPSSLAVDGPSEIRSELEESVNSGLYGSQSARPTSSSDSNAYIKDDGLSELQSKSRELPSRPNFSSFRVQDHSGHSRCPSGFLPRSNLYISQAAASSSPERHSDAVAFQQAAVPQDNNGLLAHPARRPIRYRPRSHTYSFEQSVESDTNQLLPPQTLAAMQHTLAPHPLTASTFSSAPNYGGIRLVTPETTALQADLNASPPDDLSGTIHYRAWKQHSAGSSYSTPRSIDEVEIHSFRSVSSLVSHHSHAASIHSHPGSVHRSIYSNNPTPSPRNLSPYAYSQDHIILPNSRNTSSYSSSSRNLSPYAAEFIPASARRVATPFFPLPPPFSATPRSVSSNLAIPRAAATSPRTPSPHDNASPSRVPSVPDDDLSPSPLRIPVFDDRRDPSSQPQTPLGLPRHGLPHSMMGTQNPFGPPPATAPARAGDGGGRGVGASSVRDWQVFATPTRAVGGRGGRGRGAGRNEEGENADALGEEERRWRREVMVSPQRGRGQRGLGSPARVG